MSCSRTQHSISGETRESRTSDSSTPSLYQAVTNNGWSHCALWPAPSLYARGYNRFSHDVGRKCQANLFIRSEKESDSIKLQTFTHTHTHTRTRTRTRARTQPCKPDVGSQTRFSAYESWSRGHVSVWPQLLKLRLMLHSVENHILSKDNWPNVNFVENSPIFLSIKMTNIAHQNNVTVNPV